MLLDVAYLIRADMTSIELIWFGLLPCCALAISHFYSFVFPTDVRSCPRLSCTSRAHMNVL